MNIDPQTGVAEAVGRSPRFTKWAAFLVFSTITLGASVQVKDKAQYFQASASAKYAVACSAVTFALTALVVIAHFIPTAAVLFVGTQLEGALCVVLLACWTAIVAIITDAGLDIGAIDDPSNMVQNANLYYFSWAGFFTSIILTIDYCKAIFGVDVVGQVRTRARLPFWSAFLAAALIVMGSASRTLKNDCNVEFYIARSARYCSRTKFAIVVGVLGVVFAIAIVAMKILAMSAPLMMEFGFAVFLAILNAFAVAFVTAAEGPGSAVGNLYYFSWASFLLSAVLSAQCYGEWSGHDETAPGGDEAHNNNMENGNTTEQNKYDQNGDIEVETFEGNL
jgi:hypothetical protein